MFFLKKVPVEVETDIDEKFDETDVKFEEKEDENLDENNVCEKDETAVNIKSTNDSNINFEPQVPELIPNLRPDRKKVLAQARKLIKYFKYSTVRNPILLEHVKILEKKHCAFC
jgi:hypothetical protein